MILRSDWIGHVDMITPRFSAEITPNLLQVNLWHCLEEM